VEEELEAISLFKEQRWNAGGVCWLRLFVETVWKKKEDEM
jgi:hypothetical protein